MSMIKIKVIDNSQIFMRSKNEETQDILDEIGQTAVQYAQEIVPYDTGALHDSIDYMIDKTAVRIYATMHYASFVELGTSYQYAQPFLAPAVNDHIDEYKEIAESIYRAGARDKKFRIVRF